jgi:hypothetical protein
MLNFNLYTGIQIMIFILFSFNIILYNTIGVPRENHWPALGHWQTLSHNVVSSTPRLSGFELTTLVVMCTDCIGSYIQIMIFILFSFNIILYNTILGTPVSSTIINWPTRYNWNIHQWRELSRCLMEKKNFIVEGNLSLLI